jgi:hypothetical protein
VLLELWLPAFFFSKHAVKLIATIIPEVEKIRGLTNNPNICMIDDSGWPDGQYVAKHA